MNDIDLRGRRAVITGGAEGFGRAVAERFLRSGAAVSLWDVNRGLVELMAQQLPAQGPRKLAIVTSKPITFVVAGEFKEFVEQAAVPLDVQVFADFQSAWKWLRPGKEPVAEPATTTVRPPRR